MITGFHVTWLSQLHEGAEDLGQRLTLSWWAITEPPGRGRGVGGVCVGQEDSVGAEPSHKAVGSPGFCWLRGLGDAHTPREGHGSAPLTLEPGGQEGSHSP